MAFKKNKCVYVMYNEDYGLTKIGISNNPKKRLATIKTATGCDVKLYEHTFPLINYADIEIFLHLEFGESRVRGEWFKINPYVICENIKALPLVDDEFSKLFKEGASIEEMASELDMKEEDVIDMIKDFDMNNAWSDRYMKTAKMDISAMNRVESNIFEDTKSNRYKVVCKNEELWVIPEYEYSEKFMDGQLEMSTSRMLTCSFGILDKYIELSNTEKKDLYKTIQNRWTKKGGGKIEWQDFLDHIEDIRKG